MKEDRDRIGIRGGGSGLKLVNNNISLGHSKKMRDAKDITKILAANMAAIFGVRVDAYSLDTPPPLPYRVNRKRRTTPPDIRYDVGAIAEWKNRRGDNQMDNDNSLSGSDADKKNNRKCVSK